MFEVEPVTHFVRRSLALVELPGVGLGRPRHRFPVDHYAIEVGLSGLVDDLWQVGPA